jgi:hypothetical protein
MRRCGGEEMAMQREMRCIDAGDGGLSSERQSGRRRRGVAEALVEKAALRSLRLPCKVNENVN